MIKEDGYSLCTVVYGKKLLKFKESIDSWIQSDRDENFEINIACNGLDKELVSFLEGLENKHNFINVFYFSENIGAAKGLNTCFLSSKYKYIIKLDDDVIIPKSNKDWLERLKKCFNSDPNMGAVTGMAFATHPTMGYIFNKFKLIRIFEDSQKILFGRAVGDYRNEKVINFNSTYIKDRMEEYALELRKNNDGFLTIQVGLFRIMGCLVFTTYDILLNYGLLKENFGLHGQDDIDFDRRLLYAGKKALTDTGMYYFHWV